MNNITELAGVIEKEARKHREVDKDRDIGKLQWGELYYRRSEADFVEKMRISRITFNNILEKIRDKIELQPTHLKPNPTSPERQLTLTSYRIAHGTTYSILVDVFGISKESVRVHLF